VVGRALRRFYDQQMTQHAAAMTYYAMLSLFPGLLIAVALLGLFGQERTVTDITGYLQSHGAPSAVLAPVRSLLNSAVRVGSGAISATLIASLILSLIGASGTFASARRALNAIYGIEEARPFVRRKLADFGATFVLIVLAASILVLVFLGGRVSDDLFGVLGIGDAAASAWHVARWPAALMVTLVAYAFVYVEAPDIHPRHWRTFTPGALIAVPLWLLASLGLWWYITHLADLSAYGTLAGVLVAMLWLFVSNAALLFGAELNATLLASERGPGLVSPPVTTAA
jgi:membrane protein